MVPSVDIPFILILSSGYIVFCSLDQQLDPKAAAAGDARDSAGGDTPEDDGPGR